MNDKQIVKQCRELGCCDACCIRYLGIKTPSAYENVQQFIVRYEDESTRNGTQDVEDKSEPASGSSPSEQTSNDNNEKSTEAADKTEGLEPPAKKMRTNNVCVSCLGILQQENWPQCYDMIKEMLDKKGYECDTFACALSAPISTLLRERYVTLRLSETFKHHDDSVTPLKEAWKWSFGLWVSERVGKTLDSGAVAPLLVTLTMEYADDLQELEALRAAAPQVFKARDRQPRRFGVQFTRRAAEDALAVLEGSAAVRALLCCQPAPARAVSAAGCHAPVYLAGRYVKLSRALPQTPWLLNGRRMMHSSVQEIICEPIARLYRLSECEMEHRLKFMSAGREDVDVRCLGDGRPFAVEVSDPSRAPTSEELRAVCAQISAEGRVTVQELVSVTREDLALLKKGEETKCKTYEALCIKLSHSVGEDPNKTAAVVGAGVAVSEQDLSRLNSYCGSDGVTLSQRTPVRVLHRRPLLTRDRKLLHLRAHPVPTHPQLFVLTLRTDAGTYVKEWAHGEAGRTRPRLQDALGARADILALDVAHIHLPWPPASASAPAPAPTTTTHH